MSEAGSQQRERCLAGAGYTMVRELSLRELSRRDAAVQAFGLHCLSDLVEHRCVRLRSRRNREAHVSADVAVYVSAFRLSRIWPCPLALDAFEVGGQRTHRLSISRDGLAPAD
jgi:hypothetical protein